MPRLTLFRKIFLALAVLLLALLLIFASFSWLGLQRGLGPYVAEVELRRMDWFAEILKKQHAAEGNWNSLRDDEETWFHLQMSPFRPQGRPGGGTPSSEPDSGAKRSVPPWPPRDFRPPPWQDGPPFSPPSGPRGMLPPELLPPRMTLPLPPPGSMRDPRNHPDSIYRRLGLVDAADHWIAGARVDPATAARLPLRDGDRIIGVLLLAPLEGLETEADRAFVARQSSFVVWTGIAGLAIALLLSWLLARRWFAPIEALTEGAERIAQGRLDARVPVRGQDELALLGRTFNDMAERLDGIESSRRAWLADVAHELRTPLAAMRAEIEALQDGVRSFDDKAALRLHRQVMRLSQLVDDLRSSMRDRGEEAPPPFVTVFPLALLEEALALTRERFAQHGIAVDAAGLEQLSAQCRPALQGDPRRLHMVCVNLLENTLSYTDAGGRLEIGARIEGAAGSERLVLRFDDSAPGVAAAELPRLFERLFRSEASRSRALGGSGLGLAICRATVEAHGGSIVAAPSPLGGLRIVLTLPLTHTETLP
ncbi:ATP-binding protein [Variovorax saccharolyticus]|uniref:ATP-binding protein n=1 Tax=Variovorax saccharolyticus TaxID=3053516 RepID=UPI0025767AC3|nr:ATP-binding protein [Variovorax sp. J22R187]MDM0017699.1 ATP-binding protein [Variovorax sp. J22R187]